jgi:hypothetical protein
VAVAVAAVQVANQIPLMAVQVVTEMEMALTELLHQVVVAALEP